jgi:CubicO group peptidase (beta-lactamase class C family)
MPEFIAYHNRSASFHQKQFNKLRPQGYRLISLSVYNNLPGLGLKPQYAAVWVKRPGPSWAATHNASAAEYQAFFDKWAAEGFHPVLISISGTGDDLVFAGTMEKRSGPVPLTRFGLRSKPTNEEPTDSGTIEFWDHQAREKDWILTEATIYGVGKERRYAGIWAPNNSGIAWNAEGINETADEYQARFDAQHSGWGRPALVDISLDGRYLSIFRDDQIGPWKARHDMTSDGYQEEFDKLTRQGFYPISVRGGGFGPGHRFAALFVKQEEVVQRNWSIAGGPGVRKIDAAVRGIMQDSNCRGAALALVKGTKLIFARGYTLAEPGYPQIQPTTLFRQASVSKVLTGIAIYQLIEEGKLSLEDKVQQLLNLKTPDGSPPTDPRFFDMTVRHLLEHTAGLDGNAIWREEKILAAHNAAHPGSPFHLPITHKMAESFIATQMLKWAPGAPGEQQYCNACYWLAGRIVAKMRGAPHFAAAIQPTILAPLNISRIRLSRNLIEEQLIDEARYHSPTLHIQKSEITPDRPLVARQYGGNNLSLSDASGGMSAAVVDLARIIAALNAPQGTAMLSEQSVQTMLANGAKLTAAGMERAGHGFDVVAHAGSSSGNFHANKGGAIHAAQSVFYYDSDDISMVLVWNTSNMIKGWFPNFPAVLNVANNIDWSAKDLFPQFGMPSLVQLGKVISKHPIPINKRKSVPQK